MALFGQIPAWMIAPAAGVAAVAIVTGGLVWQSGKGEPLLAKAAPPSQAVANAPAAGAIAKPPLATADLGVTQAPPTPAQVGGPVPIVLVPTLVVPPEVAAVNPAPPPPAPAPPTFDVVRVEPTGDVLVAGRGLPGARIAVVAADKVLAEGTIDAGGQFVLLPGSLAPGSHVLALRMVPANGGQPLQSLQSVAVALADKANGGVLVALTEPGKPTEVLSAPVPAAVPKQGAALAPTPLPATPEVAIRTVEVEQGGGFFATGTASAGANVRLYLNGSYIAAMQAASNGRWSLKIAKGMQPGHYAVRADQVEPSSGVVIARAEVPFDYPASAEQRVPAKPAAAVPKPVVAAAKPVLEAPKPVAEALPPVVAVPKPPVEAPNLVVATLAPAQIPPEPQLQPALRPARPEPAEAVVAPLPAAVSQPIQLSVSGAAVPVAETPPAAVSAVTAAASAADVVVREIQTATVVRGDSLWRISRQTWGKGIRYTQIYEANSAQIRDPHLIFPGQVLVVPAGQ